MKVEPVLVIAPHALDEVLGCGGTIAVHAAEDRPVHILVLCGEGAGVDGKRREAAAASALVLGALPPRFAGFPENRSDSLPLSNIINCVETVIDELRPTTVYVSHGGNLNIDHQVAFRATATALRPVPTSVVKEFYSYEVSSSTDWAPPNFSMPFLANHFVNITDTLSIKLKALEIYSFEMRSPPHSRSMSALENLALLRGASVGLLAAEAFTLLRSVK